MFCKKCGAQIDDGARFCTECGAPVERPVAQSSVPPASDQPSVSEPFPMSKKRRSKAPAIVAGLLAVAVAGAGGALYFASLSGSSTSDASASVAPVTVKVDEDAFPDAGLRYFVSQAVDKDGDGEVASEELTAVTEASIDGARDLSALGRIFPNLASLTVTGGQLTTIDVSDCPELESVDVSGEPIASLDVSANFKLASLDVTGTQIPSVDVSHNPDLSQIAVDDSTAVTGTDDTKIQQVWVGKKITEQNSSGYTTYYEATMDGSGRLASVNVSRSDDKSMTFDYSYDSQGRRVKADGGRIGGSYAYEYDSEGKPSKVFPSDKQIILGYENGMLASIASGGGTLTTLSYDAAGRLTQFNNPSVMYKYTYDAAGRLVSESFPRGYTTGNGTVTFTYDDNGNLARATTSGINEFANGETDVTCDDAGRITSLVNLGSYTNETFTYDGNGNLAEAHRHSSNSEQSTTWTVRYERTFVPKRQGAASKGLYLKTAYGNGSYKTYVHADVATDFPGIPKDSPAYSTLYLDQLLFLQ